MNVKHADVRAAASPPRILVYCVALNFYDVVYSRNIASHRAYAQKNGYSYSLVRWPAFVSVRESVWLKVPLMEAALKAGWDWVLFVDADCEVRADAPRLESLEDGEASIFLASGFSGNVNSGVIAVRNTPEALSFFERVTAAAGEDVPEADWGENGHIIHFARSCIALKLLDRRWNNNADPDLRDFIRHYSAGGPMRALYRLGVTARLAKFASRCIQKVRKWGGKHDFAGAELTQRLSLAAQRAVAAYPSHFRRPHSRVSGAAQGGQELRMEELRMKV